MQKEPALVGIVPRKNLWEVIQKEGWYHIPVERTIDNLGGLDFGNWKDLEL